MTQRDFLAFAQRVKSAGISFSEARKKFELALGKTLVQKKKAPKKPIRIVKDGIRIYGPNHERCLTDAAWQKRREEVWIRDGMMCRFMRLTSENTLLPCHKPLELHQAHTHHLRKRSLGRNDHESNLLTACGDCHDKHHQSGKGQ